MTPILTVYFTIVGNDVLLLLVGLGISAILIYTLYSFLE